MPGGWGRLSLTLRVWTDATAYAVALATAATLASVVVGIATGGGFVRGKFVTFLAGWVLVGYATVRLWPKRGDTAGEALSGTRRTRFQRMVNSVPPTRWIRPPSPTERLSAATKVLLAGVFTLIASVVMEVGFGVA